MLLVRKRTICMYSRGVILGCCKRPERGEGIMTASKILEGKVVVVTGAGNGVGAEIAKLAAASGANVLVNDLGSEAWGGGADKTPAQRTVAAITAAGGIAVPSFHSITDWDRADRKSTRLHSSHSCATRMRSSP